MTSEDNPLKKKAKKPIGLGRGLDSLLGDIKKEQAIRPSDDSTPTSSGEGLQQIAVADIRPNPDQPRLTFDDEALAELADSISRRGLIQPVVVRPMGQGFQIIAGERRWRAAQKAQLHQVPALIRNLDDAETLEVAIVENVQRRDLNAIEEARAYARLAEDYGHSQARIGALVGKSRSHVANIMRLTDLPDDVQQLVIDGALEMGHARALIGHPDASKLARKVVAEGLTVRDTEKLARGAQAPAKAKGKSRSGGAAAADADIIALQNQLTELLGMAVTITSGSSPQNGELSVAYSDLDQLDFLCQRLTGGQL